MATGHDSSQGKKPLDKSKAIEQALMDMQVKLQELESIRQELQKEQFTGISPQRSKEMLEQIIIPNIEPIREDKKKAH